MANNISWGKVYESTWFGVGIETNSINWGKIIGLSELIQSFVSRVEADAGIIEGLECIHLQ